MNREIVGIVTEEEKNELMILFERKLGVEELTATLESNLLSPDKMLDMKNKIADELERGTGNLQHWWDKMHEKYNWKSIEGYNWTIDFKTCEIYLSK